MNKTRKAKEFGSLGEYIEAGMPSNTLFPKNAGGVQVERHPCPCCGFVCDDPSDCLICYHVNTAEALAKLRYPEMGDQALSEVLLHRHARRSSKVQEDIQ